MHAGEVSMDPKSTKLAEAATSMVDGLLSAGIGGAGMFKGAVAVAEEHRRNAADAEEAIHHLIDTHVRLAALSGFATGLGGFVTMPVTIPASFVGLSVIATRMSAGIAHLRGYDVNSSQVQSVILISLLGSAGAEAMKKAGLKFGSKALLDSTAKQMPAAAFRSVNKVVGRRLLTKFSQKGLAALPKAVPVAGGLLGAAIDGTACRSIAKYAKRSFPARDKTITLDP